MEIYDPVLVLLGFERVCFRALYILTLDKFLIMLCIKTQANFSDVLATPKNDSHFKISKNDSNIKILLCYSKSPTSDSS